MCIRDRSKDDLYRNRFTEQFDLARINVQSDSAALNILMEKVKENYNFAFNDDKWNPGDIWMSKLSPSTKEPLDKDGFCPCEFTDVRQGIQEAADSGTTLGVSLKKVETSTASVQEFNTPKRTHNKQAVSYTHLTLPTNREV